MKIKKWYLFVFVIILFVCSFYVINLKFDKFYRVNGINNDNRVLIEKYLDEEEQAFLIDNQIQIEYFIDYIEYDDFYLENYQFYNALKNTERYSKNKDILEVGNELATRLNYLFNQNAIKYAHNLIDNALENAFLTETNFDFDYLEIYTSMSRLYELGDYSYINDTHSYITQLNALGIEKKVDLINTFQQLTHAFNKETLAAFIFEDLNENIYRIYNPYELTTIVDETHYIGQYQPKSLLLIQDVPRVRYTMYLQTDAYNALLDMYQQLSQEHDGFLLKEAYHSYENLESHEIGYNEFQLGLSICVTKSETRYDSFQDTDISKWLEEHAHEYGFILRYPKNKASITGHAYDSHIYRYVGKTLATSLYESSLTLEEYIYSQK